MKRRIEKELLEWKVNTRRLPLLLRGARQVGKSYILEKFGREHFDHVVMANFEFQTGLQKCFEDLDPRKIVSRLEVHLKMPIVVGSTLLVLDEIQVCP